MARAGELGEFYCFLSAYDHDNPKAVQGHRTKKPYMVIAAWRSSSESLVRIQNASLLCTSFSAETEKGSTPSQIRGSAQAFCRFLPGRLAIILFGAEHLDLRTDCRGAVVPDAAHWKRNGFPQTSGLETTSSQRSQLRSAPRDQQL